jgi:hypothetical protein
MNEGQILNFYLVFGFAFLLFGMVLLFMAATAIAFFFVVGLAFMLYGLEIFKVPDIKKWLTLTKKELTKKPVKKPGEKKSDVEVEREVEEL